PRAPSGGTSATKVMLGVAGGIVLVGCLGVGGCLMLIGVASRQQADREQEVAEAAAVTIEANALHAEYKAKEVSADGKYRGKVLEVSGEVKEISKDIFDKPYVAMRLDSNQFMTSVQCGFPDSASGQLA